MLKSTETSPLTIIVTPDDLIVEGTVPAPVYPVVGGQLAGPLGLVEEQGSPQYIPVIIAFSKAKGQEDRQTKDSDSHYSP